MKHFGMVEVITCSLLFAAPAMAANNSGYGAYRWADSNVAQRLSAQDLNHLDVGVFRPTYHSGWGGPYGDGDYPGSVDENMGPAHRATRAY